MDPDFPSPTQPPALPPRMPVPPPLPVPPNAPPALGISNGGKIIPGTEGMSTVDIAEAVLEGGKFVHFLYCVSIVVLTFRRSTDVVFLRRGSDGVGTAIGTTLLTSVLGWWGIPWGPIYSIHGIGVNLMGGRDVTREVVGTFMGPEVVAALMAKRARPGVGPLFWALRLAVLLMPVLLFWGIFAAASSSPQASARRAESPAFDAADNYISSHYAGAPGGNTKEAREMAGKFSKAMKTVRDKGFEKSSKAPEKAFPAWCEIHEHECILLVQVPELRRFDAEGKKLLCETAWTLANAVANELAATHEGMTLAVGVRGEFLYEKVMAGPLVPFKLGQEPAGPRETLGSGAARTRLSRLFAASQLAVTPAAEVKPE